MMGRSYNTGSPVQLRARPQNHGPSFPQRPNTTSSRTPCPGRSTTTRGRPPHSRHRPRIPSPGRERKRRSSTGRLLDEHSDIHASSSPYGHLFGLAPVCHDDDLNVSALKHASYSRRLYTHTSIGSCLRDRTQIRWPPRPAVA